VLALFLNRGTPHTEAIIPLLDKHGVPLVGPSTGAMVLHQPVRKHVSTCAPPTSAKPKRP
jgi:branched-chain amino acid transport system substrate-binding protein